MKFVLQWFVLLIVILLVTFYLILPKKEGFLNLSGVTSSSLYRDADKSSTPAMIDSQFNALQTTLADKGNLLYMKRCYQFPKYTLEQLRRTLTDYVGNTIGMYSTDFDMITCKFDDVESRIVCEIQKFKDRICGVRGNIYCGSSRTDVTWDASNDCKNVSKVVTGVKNTVTDPVCMNTIQGPVYAFIFQAPYYRTTDFATKEERTLALQFQTLDTMLMPFNGLQKTESDANTPIFIYVQLLFPRYNKNGTYLPNVNLMDQYMLPTFDRNFFSKEMQCFIKTVGKYDMVGGCASTSTPYEAKCLGPKIPVNYETNDEKNTPSTYGVLYQINQTYTLLNDMFTTEATTLTSPLTKLPEVYFVKGPFNNLEKAVEKCNQTGGTIASREDAYDAYAYGHNSCEPGFVDDGFVAVTSQGTIGTCSTPKGFKVTPFQNQQGVGAFCIGIRPTNNPNVNKWDPLKYNAKTDYLNAGNKPNLKCGTFSEDKYFEKYPDTKTTKMSGVQHWLTQGIPKKYIGALNEAEVIGNFDSDAYAILYNGKLINNTPLQHFQKYGTTEGNRVCLK